MILYGTTYRVGNDITTAAIIAPEYHADADPAWRAQIRPGRHGNAHGGSEPGRGPGEALPQFPGRGGQRGRWRVISTHEQ